MKKMQTIAWLLLLSAWAFGQTPDEELQQLLQKLDEGESAEHMTIHLGDINFATGTADLEPSAKSYLNKVAKLLNQATNMDLLIKGHADNTGSSKVNERLSADRAKAVRNHLMALGIDAKRLTAKGFGSTMPIADNNSPTGRARNRRVELEILRNEKVETLQDVIVLRNGERIGAIVARYDNDQITYRQFSESAEKQISTKQVDRIIFSDGRVVYFNEQKEEEQPVAQQKPKSNFNPFAESAAFHGGQFIIGMGIGIHNDVGIKRNDNKLTLLPVWMTLELPLKYNIGVGLSGGAMLWEPKPEEGVNFSYYTISPTIAYHFNLGSKLDLYTGVAATGRRIMLHAEYGGEQVSLAKNKVDVGAFVGLRYYFLQALGVCAEFGNNNVACARLGLSLRFGR